jgi:hypothetical protein
MSFSKKGNGTPKAPNSSYNPLRPLRGPFSKKFVRIPASKYAQRFFVENHPGGTR